MLLLLMKAALLLLFLFCGDGILRLLLDGAEPGPPLLGFGSRLSLLGLGLWLSALLFFSLRASWYCLPWPCTLYLTY